MSESTHLDNLLDLWESLSAEQPRLDVDEFIAAHCPQLPPDKLEILRAKIAAIQSVNRLLVDSRSQTSGSTNVPPASPLKPQQEPVPGYILQTRLGSGGFGQVWKAIGPGGFEVALKLVPRGGSAFSAESRALELIRRIHHPYLLKVYGSWLETDWLVIASELADYSLFDRLQDAISNGESGIPRDELLRYMRQAAEVIDFLNQVEIPELGVAGVQHRDIKPQNLLLTDQQVKLADLGISRPVSTHTVSHTGQLSIHYAAPEFFDGKTSRHSDQYGLAVTYVQLRTGNLPYRGNELEVFKGHVQGAPQLDGLTPGEKLVVQRALAKRPGDRWPDCRAFVEALASPPKVSWWHAVSEWLVFSPALRFTLGATTLGLLAALLWFFLPALWQSRNAAGEQSATGAQPSALTPAEREAGNRSVYGTNSPQAFRWPAIEASSFSIPGEDMSQNYRVLRGLRIWKTGFGSEGRFTAVAGIQGIYATAAGPELGVLQGFERTPAFELLAKPGYVIGRIEARRAHGGRLGGMLIEFVRVDQQQIRPDDCYRVEFQILELVESLTRTGSLERPAVGYQISRTDHELGDFGLVEARIDLLSEVDRWIVDNSAFAALESPEFAGRRYTDQSMEQFSWVSRPATRDGSLPLLPTDPFATELATPVESAAAQTAEPMMENSLGMRLRLVPAGVIQLQELVAVGNPTSNGTSGAEPAWPYPATLGSGAQISPKAILNPFWFPRPSVAAPAAFLANRRVFYCGELEVTRGQFREYVEARRQSAPGKSLGITRAERLLEFGGIGFSPQTGEFQYGRSFNWMNPGFTQDDAHPVVGVSWTDARDFCDWLSAKEGRRYRLPTSVELEFCRKFGDGIRGAGEPGSELVPAVNGSPTATGLASPSERAFTVAASETPANVLGMRGLDSNVAEWCAEEGVAAGDQTFVVTNRIFSGGSFARPAGSVGASSMLHAHQNFSGPDVGFRVVLELPND
jgi:formylglycine-generating enzyme required for sulfatase activity